jgi:hypothetical protein
VTRPVVYIDEGSRWTRVRRLALICIGFGAAAVVIWWAMGSAAADPARITHPAKAQWAGLASPFAPASAGATTAVSSETLPAATTTETPTLSPAATLVATDVQVTPASASASVAAAPAEADPQDTETEN